MSRCNDDVSQLMEDLLCQVTISELDNILLCEVPDVSKRFSQPDSSIVLEPIDDSVATIQCLMNSLGTNNNNNNNSDASLSTDSQVSVSVSASPDPETELCKFSDDDSGVVLSSQGGTHSDSDEQTPITKDRSPLLVPNDNSSVVASENNDCIGDTSTLTKLTDMTSTAQSDDEIKFYESLFETAVPVGWLSTLSNRKCRNYSTLSKNYSRKQDFAYCGPAQVLDQNCDLNANIVETSHTSMRLKTPSQASEVPIEILYSGVALAPGVMDNAERSLIIVNCDEIIWEKCDSGCIGLAQFLLYLCQGVSELTLLIDERNANSCSRQNILDALNIFQSNCQLKVEQVLVVLGEESNSVETLQEIFKVQCHAVDSCEDLSSFVDESKLPSFLGGTLTYSHADWIQDKLTIDSFVHFCESVRHNFGRQTLSMTSQSMPTTVKGTRQMLNEHHKEMSQLLDDKQITNLHNRAHRLLDQLSCDKKREAKDIVESTYQSTNDAISQFVHVADERLVTLERHLLVKQFEQSCDCIFRWTQRHTQTLNEKFSEMEDSFKELLIQSKHFEDFYMEVMQHYAKCDCLLADAKHLATLGYIREEELTQRAKLAEEEISKVVSKMESKKQEVETASHMYKFIDQAYSWALDGMKFVTMLNMDTCLTVEACDKLLMQFDEYMEQHPSISPCRFDEMRDLARRYGNQKCLRQCEFAQRKCVETADLFTKRRDLIAKAKCQIKMGSQKKRSSTSFRMKNREKLDQNVKHSPSKHAETDHRNHETHLHRSSVQSTSSNISVDLSSTTSSQMSFESPTRDVTESMTSEGDDAVGELPPPRLRPAPRKVLKKSTSLPGEQMQKVATLVHSQSGITIGSPVQVKENIPDDKSKITLNIAELISTEREYVRSLNYVIEHYFPEMCRLDIPQALRCKRNVIFGNIEKIAEFHSRCFLRDLESCHNDALLVAKTFQKHKDSFGLYALYSKNKPQSDQLLQEHGNEFFRAKQVELGDKMDLASYLLKPVQRMGKYALLLHAMAKKLTGAEERNLREAEELVKFQLRHGNDLLTMDSIRDCDVNLKEQGNLLRQEQFVIHTGRRKIIRRVFLFEELILFSKPIHVHGGHDTYQYKCSYKTAEIGMTENIGDSGFKFEIWFRRRRSQLAGDNFVLQSTTRATKRAWVDEIRGLLWKQALRNRDNRKTEMMSMGIGSKPHLDLADSSENTIVDRSVTTTPPSDKIYSDRLLHSRTRASIAVSAFDNVGLNSKRPHSIISTSSSASSVGSGGNQLVSSLTLASWPITDRSRGLGFQNSSPPMAYCDFHAIAEDEESETLSEDRSTEENSHEEERSDTAKQYITTHEHSEL